MKYVKRKSNVRAKDRWVVVAPQITEAIKHRNQPNYVAETTLDMKVLQKMVTPKPTQKAGFVNILTWKK